MGLMKNTLKTGAGLAALAAAAGAYFLTGKQGEKNRGIVKGWMLKMKGDVLDGLESLTDVNEDAYKNLVEKAAEKYRRFREANKEDFDALTTELKNVWHRLKAEPSAVSRKPAAKTPRKAARPAARRAARG